MRRFLPIAAISLCVVLTCSAMLPELLDSGRATYFDTSANLMWVGDGRYAVTTGYASESAMSIGDAAGFVTAMNTGKVPNFGYRDWRLPSDRELSGLLHQLGKGEIAKELAEYLARPIRLSVGLRATGKDTGVAFAWPVRGQGAGSDFGTVAVFATNSAQIKHNAVIHSGDVIVNDASPGPYLASGDELRIGPGASVPAGYDVKADSIDITQDAIIGGTVYCNEQSGNYPPVCLPLNLPVFMQLPVFNTGDPREGAAEVDLPVQGSATLDEGEYGLIKSKHHSVITFTGGTYQIGEIDLGNNNTVLFTAPAELRIAGKFGIDHNSYFGPAPESGIDASDIVVHVAGVNGKNGNLGSTPRAVKLGVAVEAHGNFYAPNGTIEMNQNGVHTGAFLARDVLVGVSVDVTLDSSFGNQPPTANPQNIDSFAGSVTLTLTGADPEGADLSFSVGTPAHGTLTDLTPIVPDPITDPETMEVIQPPVTSATVVYHADTPGGEDMFTFTVTDPSGAGGSALVTFNPVDNSPPAPPISEVSAEDLSVETIVDVPLNILLKASVPEGSETTFSVTGLPVNGTLFHAEVEVDSVPTQLSSGDLTYVPDSGFAGSDSFDFEACALVDEATECDSGTVGVFTQPSDELAPDGSFSTTENTPVTILLPGNPIDNSEGEGGGQGRKIVLRARPQTRSKFLGLSHVAGTVGDEDGDGFGDDTDPLPGATPVLMSAAVDATGGVSGTLRMQFEWDLAELGGLTGLQSATVRLTTNKGSIDSLDTFFYYGTDVQDGLLTPDDFEAPASKISGVAMPVPASGGDSTFSFDVTFPLAVAVSTNLDFFTLQGRVDEELANGESIQRGLQVYTTAASNLANFREPRLEVVTGSGSVATEILQYAITSLPAHGTLMDTNGTPITSVPFGLSGHDVIYTPAAGYLGNDTFIYRAQFGFGLDLGNITVQTDPNANCEDTGREPGCVPGGGQ